MYGTGEKSCGQTSSSRPRLRAQIGVLMNGRIGELNIVLSGMRSFADNLSGVGPTISSSGTEPSLLLRTMQCLIVPLARLPRLSSYHTTTSIGNNFFSGCWWSCELLKIWYQSVRWLGDEEVNFLEESPNTMSITSWLLWDLLSRSIGIFKHYLVSVSVWT